VTSSPMQIDMHSEIVVPPTFGILSPSIFWLVRIDGRELLGSP
jgi:hypothetical protein